MLWGQAKENASLQYRFAQLYEELYSERAKEYYDLEQSLSIIDKMQQFIAKHPELMNVDFYELNKKTGINILTSEDSLLRIYSWNTHTGGSIVDFANVYHFKSGNDIIVKFQSFESGVESLVDTIITVYRDQQPCYITRKLSIIATNARSYYLNAYTIENDSLIILKDLFQHEKWFYDYLGVSFNPLQISFNNHLISYNESTQTFSIPYNDVVNYTIDFSRLEQYQFNGKFFEHIVNQRTCYPY